MNLLQVFITYDNSMEQSPEKLSHSASQEIVCLLWNTSSLLS